MRNIITRAALREDLVRLGVRPGDDVMVHAAMRRVGRLLHGPDALIGALLDAVGPVGTVLAYTDWDGAYDDLLDADGRMPPEWRPHVPPFDPAASRASRENGILAEFIRTAPGARRSGNPGASVAAVGGGADRFTAGHPLDYGYGEGSPFARLVAAGGRVLMAGAPWDTMTLLHHAEHMAAIPGKRVRRYEVPLAMPEGVVWRWIEEFETAEPVATGLPDSCFDDIVRAFVASGGGEQGRIGQAPSLLVDAAPICAFAIDWLERHAAGDGQPVGREAGVCVALPGRSNCAANGPSRYLVRQAHGSFNATRPAPAGEPQLKPEKEYAMLKLHVLDELYQHSSNAAHGVEIPAGARLLFTNGQVGTRPDGSTPEPTADQAEVVFERLEAILGRAGMTFKDVAHFNVYLTDQSDVKTFIGVRDRIMGDHQPAATIVIVKGLARPPLKIEIEAVAAKVD